MQVQLNKPDLEQFIDEQVKAGRFPSREAAIEAAIERMMIEQTEVEPDMAAIIASNDQIERGEGVDFDMFIAGMKAKYSTK